MVSYNISVTESNLVLLTPQQANKSRDKLLRQEIATLFRKPASQDHGAPSVPKNHLA